MLALLPAMVTAGVVWSVSHTQRRPLPPPRLLLQPDGIAANGYATARLSIEGPSTGRPRIALTAAPHGTAIEEIAGGEGKWQGQIRAGVTPGRIELRVEFESYPAATVVMHSTLDARDRAEDGTPDFLRLDDERDRLAFRRWFTFLAEVQYFQPASARPAEINDCAALIRYAYREALRNHDSAWAEAARLPLVPALGSIAKYDYPHTPLGAVLFRVRPGPFHPADLTGGAFLQFADAKTLLRFNAHVFSRDISAAHSGDLLFFRQDTEPVTYHSMIYLGASQVHPDGRRYVLYHTGPEGADAGEMRRLSLDELLHFPQTEWRPMSSNPSFLGVARWNILR